jgi:catechol 2,3-dioxygenase-like lactoylglutathione lyase family enzyme
MKVKVISIPVKDQEKALRFYTARCKNQKMHQKHIWNFTPPIFRASKTLRLEIN